MVRFILAARSCIGLHLVIVIVTCEIVRLVVAETVPLHYTRRRRCLAHGQFSEDRFGTSRRNLRSWSDKVGIIPL
jgi:hypothetical protein